MASPEIQALAESMRRDGGAVLDLGDEARALCDRAVIETDPYFADPGVRRVYDLWRRSPAVRQLAGLHSLQEKLGMLYGRRPFPFQTLNFRVGTQEPAHAEMIHHHSAPQRFLCTVWIALEDVSAEAGPFVYYPGSQNLPPISMRDAGVDRRPRPDDFARYEARFAELISESNLPRREVIIPKGHAFVWAAGLAHGGSPIITPGLTRRSMVVHHYFEDCLYITPRISDVEGGKLYVKFPSDIVSGKRRWPKRDGKRVMPSPRALARAGMDAVMNRPFVQR
jgi:hypothetical protein